MYGQQKASNEYVPQNAAEQYAYTGALGSAQNKQPEIHGELEHLSKIISELEAVVGGLETNFGMVVRPNRETDPELVDVGVSTSTELVPTSTELGASLFRFRMRIGKAITVIKDVQDRREI